MNRVWRSFISATLLYALICPHLHAREAVCHIHAPDDYTPFSNQPLVIPAVGNQAECEQLNLERFSSRGRCHCTQDPIGMESIAPLDMMRSKGGEGQLP